MKKNRILFMLFTLTFIAIFLIVLNGVGAFSKNVVEEYDVKIYVDEYGHIQVDETIVINYKNYHNYLIRDIKYNKPNFNNEPYNKYDKSYYANNFARIDKNSFDVSVYRGNIFEKDDFLQDITNNVNIGYSFNNDKYNTESGEQIVECPPGVTSCEAVVVEAMNAGTLTGVMSFQFSYTINNMVTSFNDISELNYKVFEYMGMKVKKAVVTVYLNPNTFPVEDFYIYGHGLVNGNMVRVSNQEFRYVAKNIKETEEFEIRLLFPNAIVSNISNANKVNLDLKNDILEYEDNLMYLTYIQNYVAIIFNILTIGIIILMIFITRKVYIKYDKEFKPDFDHEYLRDIPSEYPPAIMSYLYYFMSINDEDVTATLLDLIRRGYLTLETEGEINEKKPDFTIKLVKDKSDEELLPHEKHLIDWFINVVGNKEEVTIKQIELFGKTYTQAELFRKNAETFVKKVESSASKYKFFLNTTKDKSKAFSYVFILVVFGFIMFIVGSLFDISFSLNLWAFFAYGLVYALYVTTIKKRSEYGALEFAKWKSFKKFLEDFSSFEDYPMPTIVIWEQYLAYATSLKIADKVMAQLKVKLPEVGEEGTYMSSRYYGGRRSGFYFTTTFTRVNSSISSARRNTMNSIVAQQAKNFRSGGGGGGFSRGSSSGGGGGGFRGGR